MSDGRDIRAQLAEALREQANWRWAKAEEYPEDSRNAAWAESAEAVARFVENIPTDDLRLRRIAAAQLDGPIDLISFGPESSAFASRCLLPPDAFLTELASIMVDEAVEMVRDLSDD